MTALMLALLLQEKVNIYVYEDFAPGSPQRTLHTHAPVRWGGVTLRTFCLQPQEEPLPVPVPPEQNFLEAIRVAPLSKWMRFEFDGLERRLVERVIVSGGSGIILPHKASPTADDSVTVEDFSYDSDTVGFFGAEAEAAFSDDRLLGPFSLGLYGRALQGELDVLGSRLDADFTSAGARLSVKALETEGASFSGYLSAGPGWLHTEGGDASGVDLGLGARGQINISGNLFAFGALEANGYFSEDLQGWGAGLMTGVGLEW